MQGNWESILIFAIYVFDAFCLQCLFSGFIEAKIRNRSIGKAGIMAVWILLCVIDRMLSDFSNRSLLSYPTLFLLIKALLLFLFSILWYKGRTLLKAFLVIQFLAVEELALFAAYSLYYFFGVIANRFCDMSIAGTMELKKYQHILYILMLIMLVIVAIIKCLLMYFSVTKIVKSYRYKGIMKKEALYYSLPAIAGILVSILLRQIIISTLNEAGITIYEQYPFLYLISSIVAIILLVADIICFMLYQDMVGLQRERAEKVIMQNQITQMQNAMLEMDYLYDGVRRVKHDMKNQITVLQSLLRGKGLFTGSGNDDLSEFFEDLIVAVEQTEVKIHTGNAVSDAIISNKFRVAENEIKNIRLEASDFSLNNSLDIKAYDIGIMLNNGLDNAIEACKKLYEKNPEADIYITIRSSKNGKMYFIEIENSYDGVIRFDRGNGYPISTKEESEFHGIGLKNVRSCAQKYGGDIDFIVKDNVFVLSVMIQG